MPLGTRAKSVPPVTRTEFKGRTWAHGPQLEVSAPPAHGPGHYPTGNGQNLKSARLKGRLLPYAVRISWVVRAGRARECSATERAQAGRDTCVLRRVAHELTALSESCCRCVLEWLRATLACMAMVTVVAAGCEGLRRVQVGVASVDTVCVDGLPFRRRATGRFVRAL